MFLKDNIYGEFNITEPIILELLQSRPVQRLKYISQFGPSDEYYHISSFSRFDHSVGVMLLLRKYGASVEEQVAGLLHDASHTVFSHVADWLFNNALNEDFQDQEHKNYLNNCGVKEILEKFGFDLERIANHDNFSLLEAPAPELCADRIDYTLRELPLEVANGCLSSLTVRENKFIFLDKTGAELFAKNYLERQREHWGGYEAATRYGLFAEVLKLALDNKVIAYDDLWTTDSEVMKKIENWPNERVQKILKNLRNKSLDYLPRDNQILKKKFRFIDPVYLMDGAWHKLSEDEKYKKLIEKVRESSGNYALGVLD